MKASSRLPLSLFQASSRVRVSNLGGSAGDSTKPRRFRYRYTTFGLQGMGIHTGHQQMNFEHPVALVSVEGSEFRLLLARRGMSKSIHTIFTSFNGESRSDMDPVI